MNHVSNLDLENAQQSFDSTREKANLFTAFHLEYFHCKLFYLLLIAFIAITSFASHYYNDALIMGFEVYFRRIRMLLMPLLAGGAALLLIIMIMKRGKRSISQYFHEEVLTQGNYNKLSSFFIACLSYPAFLCCFLYWKMKIPQFNAFSWDKSFADLEAILFVGNQPGELLLPYFGSPTFLGFLDNIYLLWGLLSAGIWIMICFISRIPNEVRSHYFLASLLTWVIVGLVFATIFSSAGPVYYGHVTGDAATFAPLMDHLRAVEPPLKAVGLQDFLWSIQTGEINGIAGISAMPSMHNAQAFLFVMLAFHLGRLYIWTTSIYAALILIGSVMLGWHYLIDGIVACALVLPIWWICGKLTKSSITNTKAYALTAK